VDARTLEPAQADGGARLRLRLPGTPIAARRDVPASTSAPLPLAALLAAACCVGTMSCPTPLGSPALGAAGPAQRDAASSPRRTPAPTRYEEYRVAAGTSLPIELRTALTSTSSRPADQIEGRLLRAITAGDVELVPAGAVVHGIVTEVVAATAGNAGRLTFSFTVIQHPDTGSRAMIRAGPLTLHSAAPQRGQPSPEVHVPKGTDATVTLLQPLLVRLPLV
jgi:hypothetical protein